MLEIDIELVIIIVLAVAAVIGAFVAFKCGYAYRKKLAELKIGSAEEEAKRIIETAMDQSGNCLLYTSRTGCSKAG